MKTKLRFLIAALMLLVVACGKDYDAMTKVENTSTEDAQHSFYVTVDEAVATAKQFLGAGDTRSRDLRLKNHTLYKALSGTRSEGEPIDVVFHVINFEDNQGYAIVSADSRATDVYAFSPTGNIDIDEAMENPGFQIFMNGATANYEDEVGGFGNPYRDSMILNPYVPPGGGSGGGSGPGGGTEDVTQYLITYLDGVPYHTKIIDFRTVESLDALVPSLWHQYHPYNNECPILNDGTRAAAGCYPIAIAQIMLYHEWPTSCKGYTLNWDSIKSVTDIIGRADTLAVAHLIREIGRIAETSYGTSSSTYLREVAPTFEHFGYSADDAEVFEDNMILESLRKRLPVFVHGQTVEDNGHGWVVDGYRRQKETTYYYNTYQPYSLHTTTARYRIYFHCNWGWGDGCNGYYFSNTFGNYTRNVKVVNNIKR